ncbi:MAG: ORF6N domain-containing protein [Candidatus Rokubacteria bacterium]|nr:ORF6N domain-containing protein [Candidatus Rokubacteria bacterium]
MLSPPRPEPLENRILFLRGQAVMLSRDLAELYKVTARELNQQVKRNPRRFPRDFVFQLTDEEAEEIRVQIPGPQGSWRGKLPYAFTEQGAGMLAAVLRSPTAATVTIEILRAFARLREPHEPPESTPLTRQASNLFAAIRDAVLLCREDKAFTTEVPSTYFLQAGTSGPIKIGSTRNLAVRIRTLMTMSPVPVRLLGVMKGDHEEACHMRLGVFRIHGEWFTPAEPVLEFIRANAITPRGGGRRSAADSGSSQVAGETRASGESPV